MTGAPEDGFGETNQGDSFVSGELVHWPLEEGQTYGMLALQGLGATVFYLVSVAVINAMPTWFAYRRVWYNAGSKQIDYYLSQNRLRERVRLLELTWEAAKWRLVEGYEGREGVVVIYRGETQGWVNELHDPSHWAPGCIAVDETGSCWKATGGNEYDGATEWRQVRSA